jgi:hypothetical protein
MMAISQPEPFIPYCPWPFPSGRARCGSLNKKVFTMEPISKAKTTTRVVPVKPTTMAEFWPADGRKEVKKNDGLYLKYRDETIGPFPNRTEASWYDGQIQEIISGWIDKSRFAGRIFPFGDVWYVERWEHTTTDLSCLWM